MGVSTTIPPSTLGSGPIENRYSTEPDGHRGAISDNYYPPAPKKKNDSDIADYAMTYAAFGESGVFAKAMLDD